MTSHVFNIAKGRLMKGLLDLDDAVIKCMLIENGTTLDQASTAGELDSLGHASASATIDELGTATGYTAGGEVVTNTGVTDSASINKSYWDADDMTWSSVASGYGLQGVLLYENTGSLLIAYLDFIDPFTTGGGDVDVSWNASGILLLG